MRTIQELTQAGKEKELKAIIEMLESVCTENNIEPSVMILAASAMMGGGVALAVDPSDESKMAGVIAGPEDFVKLIAEKLNVNTFKTEVDLG